MKNLALLGLMMVVADLTGVAHGQLGQLVEFDIPTPTARARGITAGPDGNVWFTEFDGNQIGRITPAGAITEFGGLTAGSAPSSITAGSDGALWFTEYYGNRVGRITVAGSVSEFAAGSGPFEITAGPDGALWFADLFDTGKIGRITTGGGLTEFPIGTSANGITAGPDGALWFTENNAYKIGRITTGGTITTFDTPSHAPHGITAGPDGALWFTGDSVIGRITTAGVLTEFAAVAGADITVGPDDALWFTGPSAIRRITVDGTIDTQVLPTGDNTVFITTGPDGHIWFTYGNDNKIGKLVVSTTTTSTTSTSTTSTSTTAPLTATTTTTLPPDKCAGVPDGPTFASLDCRLEALIARVGAARDLAKLQPKLRDQAEKAKAHKEKAAALCRQASERRTRNALRPAINKMSQFERTLRSRRARSIPQALKDELLATAGGLLLDMRALQAALRCPEDVVPPTTTTTTSTTTTTLPAACSTPFAGNWQIESCTSGILRDDTCGLDDGRQRSYFSVDGCLGGQLYGQINTPIGWVNANYGAQSSSAFTLDTGAFVGGGGCTYQVAINASNLTYQGPGTVRYEGYVGLAIQRQCGAFSCTTSYVGGCSLGF